MTRALEIYVLAWTEPPAPTEERTAVEA